MKKTAGARSAPYTLNYEVLTTSMTYKRTRMGSSECNHIHTNTGDETNESTICKQHGCEVQAFDP